MEGGKREGKKAENMGKGRKEEKNGKKGGQNEKKKKGKKMALIFITCLHARQQPEHL